MCGCRAGNNGNLNRNKLAALGRIQPVAPKVLNNNLTTNIRPLGVAPIELPPPNSDAERRRMNKLRDEAKLRTLGRHR